MPLVMAPGHLSNMRPIVGRNERKDPPSSLSDSEVTALYVVSATLGMLLCFLLALCHHRHRRFARQAAANAAAANQVTPPPPVATSPPRILSFTVPSQALDNAICPICLEDLCGSPVRAGACMHPAHALCLSQWLLQDENVSCPVCRATYQILPPEYKSDSEELPSAERADAHIATHSVEHVDTLDHSNEHSAPPRQSASPPNGYSEPNANSHGDNSCSRHS